LTYDYVEGYDYVMDIKEAERMARTLMDQHGLSHVPFRWSRGKTQMGKTSLLKNRITGECRVVSISLSYVFAGLQREDEVRDTILHEIAHALTPGHGHDVVWRAKCREIGAKPSRTNGSSARPEKAVKGICPNGHSAEQHRLPLRVYSCGKCSRKMDLDYAFTWTRNGEVVPFEDMPVRYRAEYLKIQARKALS
jgi:hypothetical protein